MSSTITPATLDAIATRVDAAIKAALLAHMAVRRPTHRPEDLKYAQDQAMEAVNASKAAGAILQQLGARPTTLPATPEGIPIHLLDTPNVRALLAALDAAVAAAELVDAERGLSNPESMRLGPSDTLVVDLAEDINQIRARVYLEVHGATGKGLE